MVQTIESPASSPGSPQTVRDLRDWLAIAERGISPEKRARRQFSNSRMIIDATRPFSWRDDFPAVSGPSAEFQAALRSKWGPELLS